ncbi:unnamed protein product [Heligmosomoides polygyrus]|uniref:CMP/dCMP-type deaminase domain-containing protein n=1 Tax=Heligmosomoides polygyrus TaxID=6339 RepID=A0A183FGF7_HELPZ|nr:unnamed protein product [Heligmosomoides polygyrus]
MVLRDVVWSRQTSGSFRCVRMPDIAFVHVQSEKIKWFQNPMSTSASTPSEITQTSALADLKRAAFLSVLPNDYDTRRHHFSFVRLTTALEAVNGKRPEKIHPSDVEYLIAHLLDESTAAYDGTTGEPITNHKNLDVLSCTAVPNRDPCDHCAQAKFHLSQLRKVYKATLLHSGLSLLSHGSGQRQVLYALEQVILEFERTQPVYLPTELDDAQCWKVARNDAEELAERFRRREQRKRFPP